MNKNVLVVLVIFSTASFADEYTFCPQKSGYIRVGMTQSEVLSACGQPQSKLQSNTTVMQKVPMLEMIFNNQATESAFYGVWNLPVSNSATGNGGTTLKVQTVDDKVYAININGASSNAFQFSKSGGYPTGGWSPNQSELCNGQSIKIGDPASDVVAACGTPRLTNETYIEVPIPSKSKPEIWVYSMPYQPTISLTFVDDRLQSIK